MNTYNYYRNPQNNPYYLKQSVLNTVNPIVQYGLHEAQYTSYHHAMLEVSAITYLMGMGYDPMTARQIVESWETNETF